jgi:hypothetical protein
VVWGDVAMTTLGALSTDDDPYGVDTLDRYDAAARQRRPARRDKREPRELTRSVFGMLNARGDR